MNKLIFLVLFVVTCMLCAAGLLFAANEWKYTYSGLGALESYFDLKAESYNVADSYTQLESCSTEVELQCVSFDSTVLFMPSIDILNSIKGVTELEHQTLGFKYIIEPANMKLLGREINGYSVVSYERESPVNANFFYSIENGIVMFEHSYKVRGSKGDKSLSVARISTSKKGLFSK